MKQYRLDAPTAAARPAASTATAVRLDAHTRRPGRGALIIAAVATLGGIAAGWFWFGADAEPGTAPGPAIAPLAINAAAPLPGARVGTAVNAPDAPAVTPAATADPSTPPSRCPSQWLAVQGTAAPDAPAQCLGQTEVAQNGGLRRHAARVQGRPAWQLEVDGGAGAVRAVRLVAEDGTFWRCGLDDAGEPAGPPCRGAAIGAPDLQGARVLQLRSVALAVASPAASPPAPAAATGRQALPAGPVPTPSSHSTPQSLTVSAQLVALGDEADPTRACPPEAIDVVGPDHGAFRLCPSGGAGAGRGTGADGRPVWHYTLSGLAGDTLEVRVDADGQVDELRLGSYACSGPACAGAETQPGPVADVAAGRVFRFSGVALQDPAQPGRFTTLNGSATMPEL